MNELITFLMGVIVGVVLTIHVIRRYHKRDGAYGERIRSLLG